MENFKKLTREKLANYYKDAPNEGLDYLIIYYAEHIRAIKKEVRKRKIKQDEKTKQTPNQTPQIKEKREISRQKSNGK